MNKLPRGWGAVLAGALVCSTTQVVNAESPLREGTYIAPMASYIFTDAAELDDGFGGTFAVGYRRQSWAIELGGVYRELDSVRDSSVELSGAAFNALWFPLESWQHAYAIGSVGAASVSYPITPRTGPFPRDTHSFSVTRFGAGVGNLFDFRIGRYEMAARAEALYVYGIREKDIRPSGELPAPRHFGDVVLNLGLQLPFGLLPPEPEPEPVKVVEVITPPDSDGDGVPDDRDQCPNTPPGEQVDDVGCSLPPPPPPCKAPEAGERISLEGCGTGDVIVLRGVHFEFNKSSLTANAMTLLDMVAAELNEHPQIKVEIGGHTDSKGADAYNQRLSEQRAQSVRGYLVGEGVAADQLTARGYGESQPVADNETDAGRELNRRVELKVLSGGGQ